MSGTLQPFSVAVVGVLGFRALRTLGLSAVGSVIAKLTGAFGEFFGLGRSVGRRRRILHLISKLALAQRRDVVNLRETRCAPNQ